VLVPKAVERMFSREHCGKERTVFCRYRIEPGVALTVFCMGMTQAIQFRHRFAFRLRLGESIQVTVIGLSTDLRIPPEVRHAFAHRQPPPLSALGGFNDPECPKLARIVERGLDPQHLRQEVVIYF